ncbi:MAG: hypothetical protein Q8S33_03710 [Myxococcales bacterium]|nr:hypothetical protein [Myxococcales bacterium]
MKRVILASVVFVSAAACFDFDGAYDQYCARNNCDGGLNPSGGGLATGGGAAGGSTAGGSTAGGSTAGGSTAGGSTAGGSTAGGSTAGGSTAGGAAGGSTAGGAGGGAAGGSGGGMVVDAGPVDAGVQCVGTPFCVHRHTQRLNMMAPPYFPDAIVGTSLDSAAAVFSRFSNPIGSLWVTHGNDPTPSAGSARPFGVGAPGHKIFGGTPFDFLVITETSLTTARIQRVIDGGIPQVRFSGGMCQGMPFFPNTYERDGNRVFIGGRHESICELNLMTGMTTMRQGENGNTGNVYVSDLYLTPGDELFWATTDGYIGKLGVGRITGEIDPDGIVGLDGIDGDNIWAVSDQSIFVTRGTDGGFDFVANTSALSSRCYSLKVTTDGIFAGCFGGIVHKTRFTDGGFEIFQLPVSPVQRIWQLSGGPEAIHLIGDEDNLSNPSSAFFFSLIPRTQ